MQGRLLPPRAVPGRPRRSEPSARVTGVRVARKTGLTGVSVGRAEMLSGRGRTRHRAAFVEDRIARDVAATRIGATDRPASKSACTFRRAPPGAARDVAARIARRTLDVAGFRPRAGDVAAGSTRRAGDRAVPTARTGDRSAACSVDPAGARRGFTRIACRRTGERVGRCIERSVRRSDHAISIAADPAAATLRRRGAGELVGRPVHRATPQQCAAESRQDDEPADQFELHHVPSMMNVAPTPCSV
ncbi:MAG: hypothetical protein JWO36_7070 [Myxococcales bacterium]|nr:hypothetical protein [Myxococcales bacterium]